MAQHDYNLANQNGAAFRADLNAALEAIQSVNSGATEPASTVAYMPWADTNSGLWKVRNAADSAWISVMSLTSERVDTADGTSYDNSGSGLAATTVKDALDELDASVSNVEGDYYSTGNIVGTVSQSGGVPTGAIIERGSNANGDFVKFADGAMVCRHLISLGNINTSGNGSLTSPYRTSPGSWTFPAEFSSLPNINLVSQVDSSTALNRLSTVTFYQKTVSGITEVQASRVTDVATSSPAYAEAIAIGRWFE